MAVFSDIALLRASATSPMHLSRRSFDPSSRTCCDSICFATPSTDVAICASMSSTCLLIIDAWSSNLAAASSGVEIVDRESADAQHASPRHTKVRSSTILACVFL